MSLSLIIPRPIRDIVVAPFEIKDFVKYNKFEGDAAKSAVVEVLQKKLLPPAESMIKATCRTALAAAVAFALFKLGGSRDTFRVAGFIAPIFSFPATILVFGSFAIYTGVLAIIDSIATRSLQILALGLLSGAAGWGALEFHSLIPLGGCEFLIGKLAKAKAKSVAKLFV